MTFWPRWDTRATAGEASEETSLVEAARRGDREAFEGLYRRHTRLVNGILLARVPPAEVEDLVQDVFVAALERLSTLRDAAAFGPWVAMIARNRATDYYRRSKPAEELPEDLGVDDPDRVEAMAALTAIQALPDAYRETLTLRLVEGMTGPEIAARTGLTEGSVRVNLHRGMKMLREKLGSSEAGASQ